MIAAATGSAISNSVRQSQLNGINDRNTQNIERFNRKKKDCEDQLAKLGNLESDVFKSFAKFSDLFERLKNRPVFESIRTSDVCLPQISLDTLRHNNIAFTQFLKDATCYSLFSLSGVAVFGIGSLLYTTINAHVMRKKIDEAYDAMRENEDRINEACDYFDKMKECSKKYYLSISSIDKLYRLHLDDFEKLVCSGRSDWNCYARSEKLLVENTVLLVNLLHKMCQVAIVKKSDNCFPPINFDEIERNITDSTKVYSSQYFTDYRAVVEGEKNDRIEKIKKKLIPALCEEFDVKESEITDEALGYVVLQLDSLGKIDFLALMDDLFSIDHKTLRHRISYGTKFIELYEIIDELLEGEES